MAASPKTTDTAAATVWELGRRRCRPRAAATTATTAATTATTAIIPVAAAIALRTFMHQKQQQT
jgi:hypothetical protein